MMLKESIAKEHASSLIGSDKKLGSIANRKGIPNKMIRNVRGRARWSMNSSAIMLVSTAVKNKCIKR